MNKIRNVETLLFVIGATTIMLLGADFPPPRGFLKMLVVIFIVASIQWCYLKWLLLTINNKGSLLATIVLFAGLGAVVTMFLIASTGKSIGNYPVLIVVVSISAAIYGLVLWLVNFIYSAHAHL
jgi:hypothetical protein